MAGIQGSLFRSDKLITDAADGLNYLGIIGRVFQILPQTDNEIIYSTRVRIFLEVPYFLQDLVSRDSTAFVFKQVAQQLCLHQRQMYEIAVAVAHFEVLEIDRSAVNGNYLCYRAGFGFFLKPTAPAKQPL